MTYQKWGKWSLLLLPTINKSLLFCKRYRRIENDLPQSLNDRNPFIEFHSRSGWDYELEWCCWGRRTIKLLFCKSVNEKSSEWAQWEQFAGWMSQGLNWSSSCHQEGPLNKLCSVTKTTQHERTRVLRQKLCRSVWQNISGSDSQHGSLWNWNLEEGLRSTVEF